MVEPQRIQEWTAHFEHGGHVWTATVPIPTDPDIVLYRTYPAPSRFTSTWCRDDGLVVVVDVEVDPAKGPTPTTVTVTGDDLVKAMRGLPVATMARYAPTRYFIADRGRGESSKPYWMWTFERVPLPDKVMPLAPKRPNRAEVTQRLEQVAAAYKTAVLEGTRRRRDGTRESIVDYVRRNLSTGSRSTTYELISQARAEKLIPKTAQGRKASPEDYKGFRPKKRTKT